MVYLPRSSEVLYGSNGGRHGVERTGAMVWSAGFAVLAILRSWSNCEFSNFFSRLFSRGFRISWNFSRTAGATPTLLAVFNTSCDFTFPNFFQEAPQSFLLFYYRIHSTVFFFLVAIVISPVKS